MSCLDMLTRFHKLSLDIVGNIEKREMQLSLIKSMLIDGIRLKKFKEAVVPKLISVRMMCIDIVESISKWKVFYNTSHTFLWRGLDYLKKMRKDSKAMLANPIFLKLKKVLLKDMIFYEPKGAEEISPNMFQFNSDAECNGYIVERYRDIIEALLCDTEMKERIEKARSAMKNTDENVKTGRDLPLLNWQIQDNFISECVVEKTLKEGHEVITYKVL